MVWLIPRIVGLYSAEPTGDASAKPTGRVAASQSIEAPAAAAVLMASQRFVRDAPNSMRRPRTDAPLPAPSDGPAS